MLEIRGNSFPRKPWKSLSLSRNICLFPGLHELHEQPAVSTGLHQFPPPSNLEKRQAAVSFLQASFAILLRDLDILASSEQKRNLQKQTAGAPENGGVFWKRSFLLETICFLGGLRVYSMLVFGGVSRNDWRMFEISYRYWVCKITVVFTTQHRSCNFWIAVTAVSLSVHHPISQPPRSSHRNLKQSYPTG